MVRGARRDSAVSTVAGTTSKLVLFFSGGYCASLQTGSLTVHGSPKVRPGCFQPVRLSDSCHGRTFLLEHAEPIGNQHIWWAPSPLGQVKAIPYAAAQSPLGCSSHTAIARTPGRALSE